MAPKKIAAKATAGPNRVRRERELKRLLSAALKSSPPMRTYHRRVIE